MHLMLASRNEATKTNEFSVSSFKASAILALEYAYF